MPEARRVPMLQGERIWLRPLEERDLEAYRRACTDRDIASLAGFVAEGVMRHARRHRGGFSDSILMSQLRDEWVASPRPKGGR